MNEQPFADPANPPKPDLTSREKLTNQINALQEEAARAIALNDPKTVVIVLQQQIVLSNLLMVDELQATQQMFERVDRRLDELKGYLVGQPRGTKSTLAGGGSLVVHPAEDGKVSQVTLSEAQQEAFDRTCDTLEAITAENDGLLSVGTQLLLDALTSFRTEFIVQRGK